jgi:hypothetical protein
MGGAAGLDQTSEIEDDFGFGREQYEIGSPVSIDAVGLGLSLDDPLTHLPAERVKDLPRAFDRPDTGPVPHAVGLRRRHSRNEQERQQRLQETDKEAGRDHGFRSFRVDDVASRCSRSRQKQVEPEGRCGRRNDADEAIGPLLPGGKPVTSPRQRGASDAAPRQANEPLLHVRVSGHTSRRCRMARPLQWPLAFALLVIGSTTGLAHDWYPIACCSDRDCHALSEANGQTVEESAKGWKLWDGRIIAREAAKLSPDRQFHLCETPSKSIICFFAPPGGS